MSYEIANMDSIVEYLRSCGLDVIERDDGLIEVEGSRCADGSVAYLVVDREDVSDIIGGVYRANKDVEDVFDEYVVERVFYEQD